MAERLSYSALVSHSYTTPELSPLPLLAAPIQYFVSLSAEIFKIFSVDLQDHRVGAFDAESSEAEIVEFAAHTRDSVE